MAYLTYDEYTEMGGTLDETAFTDLEYEARSYIDWYTFNRLHGETTIPNAVKECERYLIKFLQGRLEMIDAASGGGGSAGFVSGVASQSNDGVSIAYNVLSAKELFDIEKDEAEGIMQRCLQGVRNSLGHRLLFRGLYPGEIVR